MRFRKYSRKHAFNILYQWDITGENIDRLEKEYWENLERTYGYVVKLSEELINKLENGESIDLEVYSKKFESLADEEILADKLRQTLYKVYLLLKILEEFHNFVLTYTGFLGEGGRQKFKKAEGILSEIVSVLKQLSEREREKYGKLLEFVEEIRKNPPKDFETLKAKEEEFKKEVLEIVKEYLKEAKAFAEKRLKEDMGEIREYADKLLKAYKEHAVEVDSVIEEFLKDWTIDSLGSVERNLLRLGTAEFLYVGVQDPGRAFNDYIDFAKAFVGKRAAKFVNGVLSAIYNKKVAKN